MLKKLTNHLQKHFLYTPLLALTELPAELKPKYLPNVAGSTAETKIQNLSGNIILTIMQIVGGIAILLIIYNGFKYILARGEESEIEQSKKNLYWLAGGLFLIMTSYVIIRFVLTVILSIDEL